MRAILVVEDKPCVSPLLQPEAREFRLHKIDRLDAAMQRIHQTEFAAIFLDLRLPDSIGLETYSIIQAAAPNVPIIVLVSLQDEPLAAEAVQAGAWDYLVKDCLTQPRVSCTLRNAVEHQRLSGLRQATLAPGQDTAPHTRAGNALRKSVASLTALIENIPGSVWSVDQKHRLLAFNTRFRERTRLALGREVHQGENILGEVPEAIREDWRDYYNRGLQGERFSIVTQTIPPLPPRCVEYHFHPIRMGVGQIVGVTIYGEDFTGRRQAEEALRESHLSFQALLRQAPLPSVIYRVIRDSQGNIVDLEISDINAPGAANLGLTVETAVGQRLNALFGSEVMAAYFDIVSQVMTTGQPAEFETFFAGNSRYYLASDYRIDAEHFANVNTDITDRKEAEKALREAEERFRAVADFTYDWEYWIGTEGGLIYCSPSCERITGYPAEAFQQQPSLLQNVVHADDREAFIDHLHAEMANPNTSGFDFRILTARGEEHWLSHFCQPVYGAHGRYLGRRASNRDITERKLAEADLHASEEKFRSLFEASLDAMFLTVPDGQVIAANPAACQMFGYSEEELKESGRGPIVDTLDPRLAHALEERQRTGHCVGELTHIRKDGSKFPGEVSSALFRDKDGNIKASTIVRDITERQQMLAETRHQADRAEALARLATQLSAHNDIASLLDAVCAEAARAVHSPMAMVSLYEPSQDLLNTAAVWNATGEARPPHPSLARTELEPFFSDAKAAWVIPDLQALFNERRRQVRPGQNAHTVAIAKLVHEGQLIGILSVPGASKGQTFSPDDLTQLQALADLAAAAVAKAQLLDQIRHDQRRLTELSQQIVETQEAERRHVARELHDEIGQALTGLQLMLATLPAMPPEAAERLQTARDLADELSDRLHNLSLDLRPSMLDDLGLLPTLIWHFQRYGAQTGVSISFEQEGLNRQLSPTLRTAAYRIVQEALTNIARHAHVAEAAVRVWTDTQALHVQVEDLGNGFDEQSVKEAGRFGGLLGMRERVALLGGEFALTTAPGAGTMLLATLPLAVPDPISRDHGASANRTNQPIPSQRAA